MAENTHNPAVDMSRAERARVKLLFSVPRYIVRYASALAEDETITSGTTVSAQEIMRRVLGEWWDREYREIVGAE